MPNSTAGSGQSAYDTILSRLLSSSPSSSRSEDDLKQQPPTGPFDREKAIRRMLYRSKQRGWLELDLLVGLWAQENLHRLPDDLLMELDKFLTEENPDMFKVRGLPLPLTHTQTE